MTINQKICLDKIRDFNKFTTDCRKRGFEFTVFVVFVTSELSTGRSDFDDSFFILKLVVPFLTHF